MKRIALYDEQNTLLWEGNVGDLPLDPDAVRDAFHRLYADCSCPDRWNSVKQMLRAQFLQSADPIPREAVALLAYKTVTRFVLSES